MPDEPIIRIAMADDHVVVRSCIANMMNTLGFNVDIQADNGKELIDKLEHSKSLPDVIILDINMPVMDGLETIVILKNRWEHIPVLVLTIGDNTNIVKRMLIEGANGYLVKRCTHQELLTAIKSLYKTGVYFSEMVSKQLYHAIKGGGFFVSKLSPIEMKVLEECFQNTELSYEEIGNKMGLSKKSVESHKDSVFRKLDVHSRAGLVKYAIQNGLISLDVNIDDGKNFFSGHNDKKR